jgi:hypothetical protein
MPGTVCVWDWARGQRVGRIIERAGVGNITFSPDGSLLLTDPGRLWDVATGEPVSPPLPLDQPFDGTLSPDGRWLHDSAGRRWSLAPDTTPWPDLLKILQLQAGRRIDVAGSVVLLSVDEQVRLREELGPRYPDLFRTPFDDAVHWRKSRIDHAARTGDLASAEFHYWWLIAEAAREQAQPKR